MPLPAALPAIPGLDRVPHGLPPYAAVAVVPVLLALGARAESRARGAGPLARALAIGAIVLFAAWHALILRSGALDPPEWDFYAFWVRANVAARGLDFYDPGSYAGLAQTFGFSDAFKTEVLDLGFNYPPQTMLFLQPFGHLEPRIALLAWDAMLVVATLACALLAARVFLPRSGAWGLALATALLLLLPATASNFRIAQTNPITLLLLLLFWRDRDRPRAGLWLALMPLIKPYLALLWTWPLVRRQWRVLAVAAAGTAALAAVTALAYGPDAFTRFLAVDVVGRHPDWMYVQTVNQSLHATLARLIGLSAEAATPARFAPALGLSAVVFGIAVWTAARARGEAEPWALALVLVSALMVYPNTLQHYHLLLLVPILLLWVERDRAPGGPTGAIAAITLSWLLCATPVGATVFWAFALWWTIALAMAADRPARTPIPAVTAR